jgi:hypothetical protein
MPLEPLERGGLPFRADLDTSVGQIADPAVKPFDRGGAVNERTEADALHAAAHDISTPETHGRDAEL